MIKNTALALELLDSSSDDDSDFESDFKIAIAHSKCRSIWVENHIKSKKERGEFNLHEDLSSKKFHVYFRHTKESFVTLHDMIKDDIKKQNTNMRESISSEERLAVCLR